MSRSLISVELTLDPGKEAATVQCGDKLALLWFADGSDYLETIMFASTSSTLARPSARRIMP